MFQRLDLVRCASGTEFIVIGPPNRNRPVNPFSGINPRGTGARYKFGPKHNPVKIGTVDESHPALLALEGRLEGRNNVLTENTKTLMRKLLTAVDTFEKSSTAGNHVWDTCEAAVALAPELRKLV